MLEYYKNYQKISDFFLSHDKLFYIFKIIYKYLPKIFMLIYALTLVYIYEIRNMWVIRDFLITLMAFIIGTVIRHIINRKRPYEGENAIIPLIRKSTVGHSFPSRHAFSASIITVLAFTLSVKYGLILAVLAIITAITRVIAGVHYPLDVLGGLVLGGCITCILYTL